MTVMNVSLRFLGRLPVFTLCAAVCILTGCGSGQSGSARENDVAVSVRVMPVGQTSHTQLRSYVGEARASVSAVLSSPYPGTLEKMEVRKGDKVTAGQVVAVINSESVRSSHEMSAATLRQAEDGYERIMKVRQGGGVPDVKVVEVETGLAKARAAAETSEKAMEDCNVKAPFAGTVTDVYLHQGSEASVAAPLIRIVDENSVEIYFPVPESELAKVKIADRASVDIPALGMTGISAVVSSKGIEADELSHTYDCVLTVAAPVDGLMPGMVCKVSLEGDMQSGYVVPADLVQTDRYGRYLWIVKEGVVEKTYVKVGAYSGKGVVVESGLHAGETVICEGFQKVSTGMKVNILQ